MILRERHDAAVSVISPLSWIAGILLMTFCTPPPAFAAPQLSISPLGYRIEQLTPLSGEPRHYEVTARASALNTQDTAKEVTARIVSTHSSIQVLDGDLSFGTVKRTSPWMPVLSRDTFKLRITLPQLSSLWDWLQFVDEALDSLSWSIDCANCNRNRPPLAHAGADRTVYVKQRVILDGSASSDPDGDALLFRWKLISAPPSSAATLTSASTVNPEFVPDREGAYIVQLVVGDGVADSAPAAVTITTRNSAPVANAGTDMTALVGARVQLTGVASTDVDGDALTYAWSIVKRPAGSVALLLDSDPASPLAAFDLDKPGEYVAQLIASDGDAQSAPDTVVISTVNSPPMANAGPDRTAGRGDVVELDGGASKDVDGDALSYRWSLTVPEGSQASLTGLTGRMTSFVVDRPGAYLTQLIVNDGVVDGAADTAVISTHNTPPVARAGYGATVLPNKVVELDGSASEDADGDPLGYSWALISAPPGSAAQCADAYAPRSSFFPDRAGLYVAQLIVSDGWTSSAPTTVTFTVLNATPVTGSDAAVTAAGEAVTVAVLSNDADANGDVLNIVEISQPAHGRAYLVGNAIGYEPAAQFSGSDRFVYTVSDGVETVSAEVVITVKPGAVPGEESEVPNGELQLTIDRPFGNALLPESTVLVAGTLSAPRNTGVLVNGRPAAVFYDPAGSSYEIQIELDAPPELGFQQPFEIKVELNTADGRKLVRTTSVRIARQSPYALRALPAEGPAPLRTAFEFTNGTDEDVDRIMLDFDGDGTVDLDTENPAAALPWIYETAGTYEARVRIVTESGAVHTASTLIHVLDKKSFVEGVLSIWDGLTGDLARGDTAAAKSRLTPSAQRSYGDVFESLRNDMPGIVASFSRPGSVTSFGNVLELVVTRRQADGLAAYFVYLSRGVDGVWRVAGM